MDTFNLFIVVYFTFDFVYSQYVGVSQQVNSGDDICDGTPKTAPIEHFFNLIFSEFQSHPPVCVCVQMCVDHPTYCYPNGCFKKELPKLQQPEARKMMPQPAQGSPVPMEKSQPMSFLVDDQSNFMENLLETKFVAEPSKIKASYRQNSNTNELFRDPFKDRYQSIFKYRKAPKLHLRYNLREQVKHMKSDVIKIEKIDVSKTKWPITSGPRGRFFLEPERTEKTAGPSNFYTTTVLEKAPVQYQSKFFKRDLAKFAPNDETQIAKENVSFSLENLIENLIEHSFGPLSNDTELDLNVNLDYVLGNNSTTISPTTFSYKRSILGKNAIIILNETTNVLSLNDSDQNIDLNKYVDVSESQVYKNVFNDMIASLSKHIEKNNNSSVEMMEQILGQRFTETTETTEVSFEEHDVNMTLVTTELDNEETTEYSAVTESSVTTEYSVATESSVTTESTIVTDTTGTIAVITQTTAETEKEPEKREVKKKSHQRLMRKLQNSKFNKTKSI